MASPLLTLNGVEVRRGMGVVLSDHSLTLSGGQVMVVEGPNGSGKSTLLETAAGLISLEKGDVAHRETVIHDHEGRKKASPLNVTLVLQKNGILGSERVNEHLEMAMSMSKFKVDPTPYLKSFNLLHRRDDLVAHLSQGQARKVAVLSALLPAFASPEPCLVFLDEPDAGLDDDAVQALCDWIDALGQLGHGIFIVTHDQRVKTCATALHRLPKGVTEEIDREQTTAAQAPSRSPMKAVSPMKFGWRMQWRTLGWLNQNGVAALLTLGIGLLVLEVQLDVSTLQGVGCFLAPALAAGLCGDGTVTMLREERANTWWRGVAHRTPHAGWLPFLIGGGVSLLSSLALINGVDVTLVFVGACLTGVVSHLLRFAQQAMDQLARPNAVFVGLLTPVLPLPYALLLDLLIG